MAQDYNIRVTLQKFEGKNKTSPSNNFGKRTGKTSPMKTIAKGKGLMSGTSGAMKGALKTTAGVGVAYMAVTTAAKAAKPINRGIGQMTGNRYRESVTEDYLSLISNPISTIASLGKQALTNKFKTDRENERISYERRLRNMSLPNRSEDGTTV